MTEQSANITFVRPFALTGAIRKFRILCDGVEVARIANNSSVTVSLSSGPHSVQMKADWLGAPPLEIILKPGGHLHLACSSPDDIVQSTLATFCLPNSYLKLRALTSLDRNPENSADPMSARDRQINPSWGRVGIYCGIWFAVVAIVSVMLVAMILNSNDPEHIRDFRAEKAGQVTGMLLGFGWVAIGLWAYIKRQSR